MLACSLLAGCGSSGPSPAVVDARRLFQFGQYNEAIDALSDDDSAEAAYLKSVAMHRLKLPESAQPQIEAALEAEPDNPKYQAFHARLQLLAGDTTVAPKLIELFEKNPTSAAVALVAFYGYQGTRMEQLIGKQGEAAAKSHELGIEALKSAIILNSEIPEFQRELLALATKLKLGTEAQALADKLSEIAPDDPVIAKQRIAVLLQTGRMVTALEACEKLYKQQHQSEEVAMIYAIPLSTLPASADNDRKFREVVDRYPGNAEIVTKFAIFMTRTKRHDEAAKVLDRAIQRIKEPSVRQKLMYVAIDLPLEVGKADDAERSLERYRDSIDDPLLVNYFEGRLLYIRNKPLEAIDKLKLVFQTQQKTPGSNLGLAKEALKWMKLILTTQLGNRNLEQVQQAIKELEAATQSVVEERQQAAGSQTPDDEPSASDDNSEEPQAPPAAATAEPSSEKPQSSSEEPQ